MKGFYIYEEESRIGTEVDCLEIGYIDHTFTHQIDSGILSEEVKMRALISKGTKTKCNKEDTYDFETGALISLMKMCGLEKTAKAYAEIFDDTAYGDALIERDKLKKEIKRLKEKNAELLGANGHLRFDRTCNESTIKSLENTRDLLINKNNELIEENKRLKAEKDLSWKNYQRKIQKKQDRINELEAQITASEDDKQKNIEYYEKEIKKLRGFFELYEKENKELKGNIDELFESEQHIKTELGRLYFEKHRLEEENEKLKLDCKKLQHGYNDMIFCGGRQNGKQYTFLVDLVKKCRAFTRKCVDEWLYKIPTKREEMWEKIFTNDKVVVKVKKEDINIFLKEIETRNDVIRWITNVKPTEALTNPVLNRDAHSKEHCYFYLESNCRLWYDTYLQDNHKDFIQIDYLPPMRWDLFKKGRLAVKVTYRNYKEFYDACEKELGRRPVTIYCGDFTVSICKKDGNFEIFDIKDQDKKIVNWEDVRENKTTTEDPYNTWKW